MAGLAKTHHAHDTNGDATSTTFRWYLSGNLACERGFQASAINGLPTVYTPFCSWLQPAENFRLWMLDNGFGIP